MDRGTRVLIIRTLTGVLFGVILTFFFRRSFSLVYALELAAILVGFAYLFDYLRNRRGE